MNENSPIIIEHYDGSKLGAAQKLGKKVVAKFTGVRLIDTSTAAYADAHAARVYDTDVRDSARQAAEERLAAQAPQQSQVIEQAADSAQRSVSPERPQEF